MKYIEAIINDANKEARQNRASLNWDVVIEAIGVYLASNVTWQRHFVLPMDRLMTERVTDLNAQFNQRFPSADLLRQEWFNEYTITFAQPINATTEETIRRLIEQGVVEGWSVPTMQKHLEALFNQWMTGKLTAEEFEWFKDRMPEWRRELIARTETMKALNVVSYRLFGAWGVTQKEWLATGDRRTRPDHREADGQVVAINQPFNIGGWPMQFPGDPAGPASEVVNCRCSILPVL